jgi:hypothetical protein
MAPNMKKIPLKEFQKTDGRHYNTIKAHIKKGNIAGGEDEKGWFVYVEEELSQDEPAQGGEEKTHSGSSGEITMWNQALMREQELNNNLLKSNQDLQDQLREQRLLLDKGQSGEQERFEASSKEQKWKLPALAGSLFLVGLAGLLFGWNGRDDMAKEAKDNHLKDIEFLGEQLSSQSNLLLTVQKDSKEEREGLIGRLSESQNVVQLSQQALIESQKTIAEAKEEANKLRQALNAKDEKIQLMSEALKASGNLGSSVE